jgi:hypothetical protein
MLFSCKDNALLFSFHFCWSCLFYMDISQAEKVRACERINQASMKCNGIEELGSV